MLSGIILLFVVIVLFVIIVYIVGVVIRKCNDILIVNLEIRK